LNTLSLTYSPTRKVRASQPKPVTSIIGIDRGTCLNVSYRGLSSLANCCLRLSMSLIVIENRNKQSSQTRVIKLTKAV